VTRNGLTVLAIGLAGGALWLGLGVSWARWIPAVAAALLLPGLRVWLWPVGRCDVTVDTDRTEVPRGDDVVVSAGVTPVGRRATGRLLAELDLLGSRVDAYLDVRSPRTLPARTATHRGDFRCTVTRVTDRDLLGLWRREVPLRNPQDTLVRVLPRALPFGAPRAVGTTTGTVAGGLLARDGAVFAALRDYAPGDGVRQIDWSATARSTEDKILVRQYTRTVSGVLSIDLDESAPEPAFELGVDIAYSLVLAAAAVDYDVAIGAAVGAPAAVEHLVRMRPAGPQRPVAPRSTVVIRYGPVAPAATCPTDRRPVVFDLSSPELSDLDAARVVWTAA
jgi:uncharacterized protein (DUF58 family)